MRRLLHNALCVLLSGALVLMGTGCAGKNDSVDEESNPHQSSDDEPIDIEFRIKDEKDFHFSGLADESLLRYVSDDLASTIESDLASDDYQVMDVASVYISKEYLEELEYNSKENIFFGYSLSEFRSRLETRNTSLLWVKTGIRR